VTVPDESHVVEQETPAATDRNRSRRRNWRFTKNFCSRRDTIVQRWPPRLSRMRFGASDCGDLLCERTVDREWGVGAVALSHNHNRAAGVPHDGFGDRAIEPVAQTAAVMA